MDISLIVQGIGIVYLHANQRFCLLSVNLSLSARHLSFFNQNDLALQLKRTLQCLHFIFMSFCCFFMDIFLIVQTIGIVYLHVNQRFCLLSVNLSLSARHLSFFTQNDMALQLKRTLQCLHFIFMSFFFMDIFPIVQGIGIVYLHANQRFCLLSVNLSLSARHLSFFNQNGLALQLKRTLQCLHFIFMLFFYGHFPDRPGNRYCLSTCQSKILPALNKFVIIRKAFVLF